MKSAQNLIAKRSSTARTSSGKTPGSKVCRSGNGRRGRRRLCHEALESRRLLAHSVWQSDSGGSWSDPSNWSASGVPGSGDAAIFLADDAGTVRLGGAKVDIDRFIVGNSDKLGRVTLDLDGGRLTVDSLEIGIEINDEPTDGMVTIRDGAVTVHQDALVGNGYESNFFVAEGSFGRINVEHGGRLDVSGKLLLGALHRSRFNVAMRDGDWSDGLVVVREDGLVTTDSVRFGGVGFTGVYIGGGNARWINDGHFDLGDGRKGPGLQSAGEKYLNVGPGGYLQTSSLESGPVYITGGEIFANHFATGDVYFRSGKLVVDRGALSSEFDHAIVAGSTLTLQNGATHQNTTTTFVVGGQDSFEEANVNVLSASGVARTAIRVLQNGNVTVDGSDSLLYSDSFLRVEDVGANLEITDGARAVADSFSVIGGGLATISDSGSRIVVTGNVTIGGDSIEHPGAPGTSRLFIRDGARLFSEGNVAIVDGSRVSLTDGARIDATSVVVGGGTLSGGGLVDSAINIEENGRLSPGARSGVLNTGSVAFDSDATFEVELGGLAAGSEHSKLSVQGTVTLGGSALSLSETFSSQPNDSFVVIANDGVEPIVGTFQGLPEGSVVVLDGVTYSISYQGGDGNDVELVSNGNLPVILEPNSQTSLNTPRVRWFPVEGAASYTLVINNVDTGLQNVVNVSGVVETLYDVPTPLDLGQYEAVVQAFDAEGNPSLLSPPSLFTVVPPFTVDTNADTLDANVGDGTATDSNGNTSLRSAIMEANTLTGFDKIDLPAGTFTLTRSGSGEDGSLSGDLDITDDLVIVGAGPSQTIIDADDLDRIFDVHPGVELKLIGVRLTRGDVPGNELGGALQNRGQTDLIDVFIDNSSAKFGGGIAVRDGTVSVTSSRITNNNGSSQGGGVVVRNGHLSINDSDLLGNSSVAGGGVAIYAPGTASISGTTISQNVVTVSGAGVYAQLGAAPMGGASLEIVDSEISDNVANNVGGGLALYGTAADSLVTIDNSQILRNSAITHGSGIDISHTAEGELTITGSELSDNSSGDAGAAGGALFNQGSGPIRIERSSIRNNDSGNSAGGAIYNDGPVVGSSLTIVDSTLSGNESDSTGGAIRFGDGELDISGSTLSDNRSERQGGAISLSGDATFAMVNSTLSNNRAENHGNANGGGLYLDGSVVATIRSSTITGNHADGNVGGGGLASHSQSTLHLHNTIIAGNTASVGDQDIAGPVVSEGHNLIGDVGTSTGFVASDLVGGNGSAVIDAELGPLQDNGGPTETHQLLSGSPAVNAGDSSVDLERDQVGNARIQDTGVDIGAVERVFDLVVREFVSDGEVTISVTYEIVGANSSAFDLGFYLSGDVLHDEFDELLHSVSLVDPADLTMGTHVRSFTIGSGPGEVPFPGAGVPIDDNESYLLVVADPDDAVRENDLGIRGGDNAVPFVGVYHPVGGSVFVHGSPTTDEVHVTRGSVRVEINGHLYTYAEADVTDVRLQSHAGNDVIRQDDVSASVHVVGGRGDNELQWDGLASRINLASLDAGTLSGAAAIDLTGTNANLLILDFDSVDEALGLTRQLRVLGDADDAVYFDSGWESSGAVAVFGIDYDVFTQEQLTLLVGQTTRVVGQDFGDAPFPYPTTVDEDGPSHIAFGPRLGARRDGESDGLPSAEAFGDDTNGIDDEDGVIFGSITPDASIAALNIELENAAEARVDAWIDFDRDGVWTEAEKILDSVLVNNLVQTLNYNLPSNLEEGETYARVRLSSEGGLSPIGPADDGEIEDYLITIASPPVVEEVVINDGDSQRSLLTELRVVFDRVVDIDDTTGDPFAIIHVGTGQAVTDVPVISESNGKTVVEMTFDTSGLSVTSFGSLIDGDYRLTIDASLVTFQGIELDGDGNGTAGGNHVIDATDGFFRKYGDRDGGGSVNLFDFAAFRSTYLKSPSDPDYIEELDSNGDDIINLFDFAAFRGNFGS